MHSPPPTSHPAASPAPQRTSPPAGLSDLHSHVSELVAQQPFAVHWQIRALQGAAAPQTRASIGQGDAAQVASFSTRKVSLLLACLALVHRGDVDLDQRLLITEEMREGVQAGIMKNLAPGVELSLEDHLRQMMISSDNICTQLVFEAIAQATGDSLQWVNDYCSWIGMHATLHREIFPRSGDLAWHHSIHQMTVTTPRDQAWLLELLGRAAADDAVAAALHLSPSLCRFAVTLMRQIHTPLLGALTTAVGFAEKNGRGLRSLSQVGLALDPQDTAVAAVAVFAEQIPTELPTGRPGRLAVYELFAGIGRAVEQWHMRQRPTQHSSPSLAPQRSENLETTHGETTHGETTHGPIPHCWKVLAPSTPPQGEEAPATAHPLSGAGKLLAALAIAEAGAEDPVLLRDPVTITAEDRRAAAVGPLRTHTGELTLCLADALALVIATSDASAALALRRTLKRRRMDLPAAAEEVIGRVSQSLQTLERTVITAEEDVHDATGDLLTGRSSPGDLVTLLTALAQAGGLQNPAASSAPHPPQRPATGISHTAAEQVLGWMAGVFEPTGLAYGLPGYGPRRVPQWSVSGLELRATPAVRGWTSVLITRQDPVGAGTSLAVAAAHLPHLSAAGQNSTLSPAQRLGALGLGVYRALPGAAGRTDQPARERVT